MKPITLQPVSVLAGFALAGVLAAASQSVVRVQPFPKESVRVVGEVPAEWWMFARVEASASTPRTYTVPSDRHLVVTDYKWNSNFTGLLVNGIDSPDTTTALDLLHSSATARQTRIVFAPGTVFSFPPPPPTGGFAFASLWGYLEPL